MLSPEDFLFVKQSADYRFRLDLSRPDAPVLSVTRIEAAPVVQPDPHLGHKDSAALRFKTYDGKTETVRFSSPDAAAPLRSYAQSTTMQLRRSGPAIGRLQRDGRPARGTQRQPGLRRPVRAGNRRNETECGGPHQRR
ncbi:hypothetical protein LP419_27440 [Massilia sp. H-1]|nr:hypothetical protein LP419_27440 [Massilia sp. H-1]